MVRSEKHTRPEVHVQVEFESHAKENVLSVHIAGHSRVPQGAEKDRVMIFGQRLELIVGNRDAVTQVTICAEIPVDKLEAQALRIIDRI